jgi:hypothetical protein
MARPRPGAVDDRRRPHHLPPPGLMRGFPERVLRTVKSSLSNRPGDVPLGLHVFGR